jgi:hypothetical protein
LKNIDAPLRANIPLWPGRFLCGFNFTALNGKYALNTRAGQQLNRDCKQMVAEWQILVQAE